MGALGGALAGESGLFGQYRDGNFGKMVARALVSGAAGCAGAVITGGKCAQAAVTAAFASLYNGESGDEFWRGQFRQREQHRLGVLAAIAEYEAKG